MYMNIIIIPPIIVINNTYENHEFVDVFIILIEIIIVCVINIDPIAMGCFIMGVSIAFIMIILVIQ